MESLFNLAPIQCHELKKGHHVMIKQRPCKVVEISVSKTGKHGHMKVHCVGIDLLTHKKYEFVEPGHVVVMEFKPIKDEYTLVLMDDNNLTCMDKNGTEVNIVVNIETEIYSQIKKEFDNDKTLILLTINAPVQVSTDIYTENMGIESFKEEKE